MVTKLKKLDKYFLEEKCKYSKECRGKNGGCPYNHHDCRGFIIPSREKIFKNLCKWDKPWENKRCKRLKCSFDHFKGRVEFIEDIQFKNKIKNILKNDPNLIECFNKERDNKILNEDISWKNLDSQFKIDFINFLNNKNDFNNYLSEKSYCVDVPKSDESVEKNKNDKSDITNKIEHKVKEIKEIKVNKNGIIREKKNTDKKRTKKKSKKKLISLDVKIRDELNRLI
jgi:hypothetical protein